ncbi:MAG: DUF4238 domain-containing protein [Caulobacter sp.]|nr:DUF4238 domain-containing protein [Vitreoscilla sp.]
MKSAKQTHGNHHFVPEFYLRAWATSDESQARRLTYYRWVQGRLIASRISPKGAAAEAELYASIDKEGGKSQTVEMDYFGPQVDDPAAPVITKMLAGNGPLTSEDAAVFARYLLAQRVRTPGYVGHLRSEALLALDDVARSLEADYQKVRHETAPATMADFFRQSMPHVEHYIGVHSLPRLIDQPQLLADILGFDWAWGPVGFLSNFISRNREELLKRYSAFVQLPHLADDLDKTHVDVAHLPAVFLDRLRSIPVFRPTPHNCPEVVRDVQPARDYKKHVEGEDERELSDAAPHVALRVLRRPRTDALKHPIQPQANLLEVSVHQRIDLD